MMLIEKHQSLAALHGNVLQHTSGADLINKRQQRA